MASRAIHLEVAHRMDTDSFLNAYRRFICRRGPVRQIRSDQASNFKGVENELKAALKEMDNTRISKELLKNSCDWLTLKMNTPESSHMGGSWERLIRSVRNVLVSLLHHHMLDDEALMTFMTEAEYVVNSRPLSIFDINDPNYPGPISPNHLLTMTCQLVLPPPGVFLRQDMYLRKRWRRVQFLANEFWKRWRQEYLQSLQPRQKWYHNVNNLKVNDIVLVKDDHLPRNLWNLGRISEIFPSEDSLTRKVKVELSPDIDQNGQKTSKRKCYTIR